MIGSGFDRLVSGVAQLETDLLALLTGSGAKNVLNQVSGAVTQAAGVAFCQFCGAKVQ